VLNALRSLIVEALLGALLTGVVVLLFLRDWRSAAVVVVTIPVAILTAAIGLAANGRTINIMTLSGLALAVGILVDQATVTMENIHRHLEQGERAGRAIASACREIIGPELLILASMLAVFAPAAFMTGTPRAMFLPLSLAVSFAMIASFLLSQTLVPVLANWMVRQSGSATHTTAATATSTGAEGWLGAVRRRVLSSLAAATPRRALVLAGYAIGALAIGGGAAWRIGTEIFPRIDHGQFQLRLRAAPGTRLEKMEQETIAALRLIQDVVGPDGVEITSAFIGSQPPSYPINTIYLWTSGPHEAVMLVKPPAASRASLERTREALRAAFAESMPELRISFEPGDLVDQVMAQGATTPIEVAVIGRDLAADRSFADTLRRRLAAIPALRDVGLVQPIAYPAVKISIDRERAGVLGTTVSEISQSLVAATSSSRFTQPNYWLDEKSGTAYQVQVEVPQSVISSAEAVKGIPVRSLGDTRLLLGDVATVDTTTTVGEFDRINQQRMVTLTANVHDRDLGGAATAVRRAISGAGTPPAGVTVRIRGQIELMDQMFGELRGGVLLALFVIFLLLAGAFQSFRLALVVLSTAPAVIAGSLLALVLTGDTLNIQSYMGMIMSLGVSAANAILLITAAESARAEGLDARGAAFKATDRRLRPILMTTLAMLAGMIPIAIGIGEGGEQTAPLGVAVIGGLVASAAAVLFVLPLIYGASQSGRAVRPISLDPDDPKGVYANT
jgi:multidrug efflux pump subunit AcrB